MSIPPLSAVAPAPPVPTPPSGAQECAASEELKRAIARHRFNEVAASSPAVVYATPQGVSAALSAAVEALCLGDAHAYGPALWTVVRQLDPRIAGLLERNPSAALERVRPFFPRLPAYPPTGS